MTQNICKYSLLVLCVLWAIRIACCSQEEPEPYCNPIMNTIVHSSPAQFNQLLKTFPDAVHTQGDHNNTPLHEILIWSATLTVPETLRRAECLITAGADVNAQNDDDNTPLHLAADRGLLPIVKLLVRHGAAVNKQNGSRHAPNNTPLHLAVQKRHEGVAQFLLGQEGILVDVKNTAQGTPLHYAIEKGLLDTVKLLVVKGASLDARTKHGLTPLHCAAASGREDIVSLLIDNGADISSIDKDGDTPLHLAAVADRIEPARLLLAAGCDINALNSHESTPLHLAVRANSFELAEFFVSSGADIDALNDQKKTPLEIAIVKKHNHEIAHLLIARGATTDFLETRDIIRSHMGWQGAFLLDWKKIQKETKTQRLDSFAEISLFPFDIDKLILALAFNDIVH